MISFRGDGSEGCLDAGDDSFDLCSPRFSVYLGILCLDASSSREEIGG